jgi:RimJ/RimL family protein N-acetyltransferase
MKSTQIELIPLSLAHAKDLLPYAQDPTLWTWWARTPLVTLELMQQEIELALEQQAEGSRLPYTIRHLQTGALIGSTSYMQISRANKSIEIGGTWLTTQHQSTGINRECKTLLLNHAFHALGMNRVALQTDALNSRSRRAIEKLGATFEGIMRNDRVVWDGRVRSSAYFSILREEWLAQPHSI